MRGAAPVRSRSSARPCCSCSSGCCRSSARRSPPGPPLLPPAALAAGIVLQLEFPGDFGTKLSEGGPSVATWIALWGGIAALVVGAVLVRTGRGGRFERPGPIAALSVLLFVLPVAVHG